MIGSATITATTGPGNTVTTLPLVDITNVEIDLVHEVISFKHGDNQVSEFSLVGVDTLTTTITGVTGSGVTFLVDLA